MMIKQKIFSISLLIIIFGLSFQPALATVGCSGDPGGLLAGIGEACYCMGDCGFCQIFLVVNNILNFAKNVIVLPVAVILIIYGGILIIFSGGDTSKLSNGKKIIYSAIIGIAIIFAVTIILNTFLLVLTGSSVGWVEFMRGKGVNCGGV